MEIKFENISKAQWLEKLKTDLKGKPLSSLDWQHDGTDYSPIFHQDDKTSTDPITIGSGNDWEIGYRILVGDSEAANHKALDALNKGVNSLRFVMEDDYDLTQMGRLLKGINHEWISTHIRYKSRKSEQSDLNAFINTIRQKNQNQPEIRCSFDMQKLSYTLETKFPKASFFEVVSLDLASDSEIIANMLNQANHILTILASKGTLKVKWYKYLIFRLHLNNDFHANIAKIRALKLLWKLLMSGWGVDDSAVPKIEAVHSKTSQSDDENKNKISATAQALSAVIGGVSGVFIHPSDDSQNPGGSLFSNRIAINLSHLLQQESYMTLVHDAAKGSYFFEQLTNDIAAKAWEKFQKLDAAS